MFLSRRAFGIVVGGVGALAVGALPSFAAAGPGPQVAVAGAATLGSGTTVVGSVPGTTPLSIRINLGLRDEAAAERYGIAAATPGTAESGRFLSEAQFQARFGPRAADVDALRAWLRTNGITVDEVVGNQVLLAHGTSSRLARAFGTRIERVRVAGALTAAAVTPLKVPAALSRVVDGVAGLRPAPKAEANHSDPRVLKRLTDAQVAAAARPQPAARPVAAAALPNDPTCPQFFGQTPAQGPRAPFSVTGTSVQECSVFTDPAGGPPFLVPGANYQKVRTLASIDPRYRGGGAVVGIVLWNNDPQAAALANVAAATNRAPALRPGQLTTIVNTNAFPGCQQITEDDKVEINLDVQAVHAASPEATIRYYGSNACVIPEISLARAVGEQTPPSVITNSWGFPNFDYEPRDPTFKSIHTTLVKAAVRGVSVLFSSGDTGDGTLLRQYFPDASPTAPYPARTPSYPATDPYVAAVGGVGFGINALGRVRFKQAWSPAYYSSNGTSPWVPFDIRNFGPNGIGTGGGVSRAFAAPAWQKQAGAATTNRTIPDISNVADIFFLPFVIAINSGGTVVLAGVGGTSVASPVTAGQVANAAVVQRHRYAGVLTPSIYRQRAGSIVSDVVRNQTAITTPLDDQGAQLLVGGERGRESLLTRPGWDNATGLGVPSTGWLAHVGR